MASHRGGRLQYRHCKRRLYKWFSYSSRHRLRRCQSPGAMWAIPTSAQRTVMLPEWNSTRNTILPVQYFLHQRVHDIAVQFVGMVPPSHNFWTSKPQHLRCPAPQKMFVQHHGDRPNAMCNSSAVELLFGNIGNKIIRRRFENKHKTYGCSVVGTSL